MNWKGFSGGLIAGLIAGYFIKENIYKHRLLSGETVLADVKNAFKAEGKVDGSWLQMKPEEYQHYAVKTKVYRGGITRQKNGERQQYEFIADAYTGTVIDIFPI